MADKIQEGEAWGARGDAAALVIAGVGHVYDAERRPHEVLRGIDLVVRRHEIVSVIGPSGCGKSTLLFIVAGFIRPTSGIVRHDGRPVGGPDSSRGVVFQADAVFPWLTVYDNVAFGLRSQGVPRGERDAVIARYIRLVGLEGAEHLYPKQLSGGMRKRVDVARVFASGPDILLMDESFGSLDTQTKENLQLELLKLCDREHKTVIFVTHDIEEAIFLADRVVIMSRNPGQINETVSVPFARPRAQELRVSSELQDLRARLHDVLARL